MATGHAYDSEGGRAIAGAITSLMTGTAYRRSAELAAVVGPYDGYARNADAHKRVMRKHAAANDGDGHAGAAATRTILTAANQAWGECLRARRAERLPQRAGHRARADRHHRPDDGLRHHRHRAGPRAGQVQEAGRRRLDADRQPDRAARAEQARLPAGAGRGDRRVHRRARPRRRRARPADRALRGLRLRDGRALDQPDGPRPDDGGGPAVPVRRDLQDGQPAGDRHRRGHREDLLPGLEARPEGARDLPRQLQGRPAAVGRQGQAAQSGRTGCSAGQAVAVQAAVGRPTGHARRLPKKRPARPTSFSRRRRRGLHDRRRLPGRRRSARSSSSSASRARPWPA